MKLETTKGFQINSVALGYFLLFSTLMYEASYFGHQTFNQVDIVIPEVVLGDLLVLHLIYLPYLAWTNFKSHFEDDGTPRWPLWHMHRYYRNARYCSILFDNKNIFEPIAGNAGGIVKLTTT